jgi:23S rRNA pseudouridine1911/1915/1917 synthase
VLCDRLYGGRAKITELELLPHDDARRDTASPARDRNAVLLDRQALHAEKLTITHPTTRARMTFEAPLPADMARMLEALRRSRKR